MNYHSERSEVQRNEVEGIPWNYLEVSQRDPSTSLRSARDDGPN
jgi:hypothetical protein